MRASACLSLPLGEVGGDSFSTESDAKLRRYEGVAILFSKNRKKREYSTFCNSFVRDTYVRLRARLTFVCGEHLHALVRETYCFELGMRKDAVERVQRSSLFELCRA